MDLSRWLDSIYEHACSCNSFALMDGVVTTELKLDKLCSGLKPMMLYDVGGFVFQNTDNDDFDRYDYELNLIGDSLAGKLKSNYLIQPYGIFIKPIKEQEALLDVQMHCVYKQFLLTGAVNEVSVWAQFTNESRPVPGCAFAIMCLCFGMRHKVWPMSIYEMICELWPAEVKRCRKEIKIILNAAFLEDAVREMTHGEVEVLKDWGDEALENVEEIAKKGEKLVSMMKDRGIEPVEMQ